MTSTLKSLRALSDPTRLRIVALLEKDELSVNELQEITRLGQSRISTHLGLLSDCDLVRARREGKRTFYKLNPLADTVASEFIELAIRGAKELSEHASDQINLKRILNRRREQAQLFTGRAVRGRPSDICCCEFCRRLRLPIWELVKDCSANCSRAGARKSLRWTTQRRSWSSAQPRQRRLD